MRAPALVAGLLLLPMPAIAQHTAPAAAPTAEMMEFEKFADVYAGRLVAAFDSIPANDYGFHPTPVEQTVGYIAQHLENANYALCGSFGHLTHVRTAKDALPDTVKAHWPKDTLVARLRASERFCDEALDRVSAVRSADVASALLGYETDQAEHYSQISVYMRMLGLVPPSALPRVFPRVITLPASTLSRYVGTYRLTRGLDLVVTLRTGKLWVRSSNGGATVRLWPSSPTGFFVRELDADVTFTPDAGGRVNALSFREYGRSWPAQRVR